MKNHTVKMCTYSSIDYVLTLNKCVFLVLTDSAISRDCNISFNLLETRPSVCKSPAQNDLQTEGRVSSKLRDMLQSVEIMLFMTNKRTRLLRG